MKVNPKQLEGVLALPGSKRYEHFIKVIADWQEVWGLFQDGWALAAVDDGTTVFPFWPAKEYALVCAENEWKGCVPRSISLSDFTDVLLPKLKVDGVLPVVFFTPSVDELKAALEAELKNY